jgi:putative RNA 2'-phosphotransferase
MKSLKKMKSETRSNPEVSVFDKSVSTEIVMSQRLIKISKFLSKHLRHTPEELGLTLQPGGWVNVDDLLLGCKHARFEITYDDLIDCVETSDKRRFAFDPSGESIRANQGHSVEVDLQLEPIEPPALLYHGTVERFLSSIFAEGLLKRNRHHVHLSKDIETAIKVGSRGKPVILTIDSGAMHKDGIEFFQSANGVWLTEEVPPQYLTRIES